MNSYHNYAKMSPGGGPDENDPACVRFAQQLCRDLENSARNIPAGVSHQKRLRGYGGAEHGGLRKSPV